MAHDALIDEMAGAAVGWSATIPTTLRARGLAAKSIFISGFRVVSNLALTAISWWRRWG